ncbi:MAG TPA: sugar phosphate isomerase/epimerase [Planctomycetaceae bacterium]|nr:sugar phosphate isomerase/epimerase [Planctomycetaceae bacterium]
MKYGMNMLLWTTDVTEAHYPLLDKLKAWGYDGVEVPVFELDPARFKDLAGKLDSLGLGRTAVAVSGPEANPISDSASIRQAAVDRLKRVVDMCQIVGVDKLCGPFHSAIGQFSGKGPTADEWKWGKETLAAVAAHAAQAGVTLVLEYLNRFECYLINCAADTARFVKEINHPNVRMMYDTFHANVEEKSVAAAIKVCAPVMVHVHISENDRATPGEGHVDWDSTFKTLKDVQYEGWMVVEAFGLALPALAAATKIWRRMYPSEEYLATRALRFMKSRWEH